MGTGVCVYVWGLVVFILFADVARLRRPWIYVGGFWLIDIHTADIIYNGIQFALNHSPTAEANAVAGARARVKYYRKKKTQTRWKRNKKIPLALAICFFRTELFFFFFYFRHRTCAHHFSFHISSYRSDHNAQQASILITHCTKENLNINFEWIRFPRRYSYSYDAGTRSCRSAHIPCRKKIIILVLVRLTYFSKSFSIRNAPIQFIFNGDLLVPHK